MVCFAQLWLDSQPLSPSPTDKQVDFFSQHTEVGTNRVLVFMVFILVNVCACVRVCEGRKEVGGGKERERPSESVCGCVDRCWFKSSIFGTCIVLGMACLSSMLCWCVCQVTSNDPISLTLNSGLSAEEESSFKEKNNNGNLVIHNPQILMPQ